jgi:hypothetical protein
MVLHLHGRCGDKAPIPVNEYLRGSSTTDSACYPTKCPSCGVSVYFIKHNNGIVWIDAPLGPPWKKHPCFSKDKTEKHNLANEYKIKLSEYEDKNLSTIFIGVVSETTPRFARQASGGCITYTDMKVISNNNEVSIVKAKHTAANYLVGHLCVFDVNNEKIWPISEPNHIFDFYISPKKDGLISCPECNSSVSPKNLKRHLKNIHKHKL